MTQTAFLLTFLAGSVFGAALMAATALARSERLRKRHVARWFALWIVESNRTDKAEAELAIARDKLSRGGRKTQDNYRARVRETTELMRAQMNAPNSQRRKPELKVAA